jgi:hypothetical protein
MLVAIMAMAVILDSHSSPDPASLVAQLGSSRYASRISAEGELARLGRSALPALRAARTSKDAEIRSRSVALVARIENSLLLESTPIGLDFEDVRLPEAIEAIGRGSGFELSLPPRERSLLADRRISVHSDGPLPFWKAIDAFCSAGKLHPALGDQPVGGLQERSLLLLDGPTAGPGRVSDYGAFRVHLTSVHYQSEIQLDQPQPSPLVRGSESANGPDGSGQQARASRDFFLQFVLSAEPRLSITRNGLVKVTAVDDQGRSLVSPSGAGDAGHYAVHFGVSPSSTVRFRVDLEYPEAPARRLRSLKGTIPVIVATRKADPIVVPLAGSRGKLFRNDEIALTLLDHRPASANQPATLQVSIQPLGAAVPSINRGNGEPPWNRPDTFQQQIEILDDLGRPLPWFPSTSFYDGDETRLTLTVGSRGTAANPRTLRYHGLLKANSEVAFEFRDIPIP